MTQLVKARITAIDGQGKADNRVKPFDVQFNPATLRMQVAAPASGGAQRSQPRKQHASPATTTLTMELSFDTYDEGTTQAPVPVTKKTALLEQFLKPVKGSAGAAETPPPPRIRFAWGHISLDGVVKSLSIDYEHFHPGGAPLRAKCSLSMESQDPLEAAPEASASRATRPGELAGVSKTPTAAGANTLAPTDDSPATANRIAPALDGESLAAFAARNGLDPKAWREIAGGIGDTLVLQAGLQIGFSDGISGRGREKSPAVQKAADLTAAGGPATANAQRQQQENDRKVAGERAAFAVAPARSSRTDTPIVTGGPGGTGSPTSSADRPRSAALRVRQDIDRRPFGAGLPLRPTIAVSRDTSQPAHWSRQTGQSTSQRHSGGCGCGCGK